MITVIDPTISRCECDERFCAIMYLYSSSHLLLFKDLGSGSSFVSCSTR